MAIKVEFPNPSCGKILLVKNHWAGKKGACTECGTVIQVPVKNQMGKIPSGNPGSPKSMKDTFATKEALSDDSSVSMAETSEENFIPKGKFNSKSREASKVQPAVTMGQDEESPLEDIPSVGEEPGPRVRLARFPLVCLVLGIVSIACVALWPFLGQPSISGTGDLKNIPEFNKTEDFPLNPTAVALIVGIPLAGAFLAAVGLMISLLQGRFGIAALLTAYPVWLLSIAIALFLTVGLLTGLEKATKAEKDLNAL